jgi:hypothetical protein
MLSIKINEDELDDISLDDNTDGEPNYSLSTEYIYDSYYDSEYNYDECTICLEPFNEDSIIFDCHHRFHFECILFNIINGVRKRDCPLCRKQIKITKENDNKKQNLIYTLNNFITDYDELKTRFVILENQYDNQQNLIRTIRLLNWKASCCFFSFIMLLFLFLSIPFNYENN